MLITQIKRMGELLDAVHNVPDLLARWQDMREEWVLADLEIYEKKYCDSNNSFYAIVKNGAELNRQLEWKSEV